MAATENRHHPRSALALPALIALAFVPAAQALDWRFEPSVRASATYTDNANHSEHDPKDALILTATPGFSLASTGTRRVQAALRYGLTGVARFGEKENTDLFHRLNATGNAELVEDFLFIDGNARISQELISLFGSPAEAETDASNRATVGTYSISPYIQKRLGTFANALARYSHSGTIFENDASSRATLNAFTAALTSGTRFNNASWGLNYSISKAEYNDLPDATFESVSATAGYALTRKFRVFGTVGEDRNDYLSFTETDGSFYSLGFGWSPSRRTSIEAAAGERYFGKTFSFAGSHRTRLSRWTLSYSESVSDVPRLNTSFEKAVLKSCPPGTILPFPPTLIDAIKAGCDFDLFFNTSITNRVFIAKLLTGGVSWDVGTRTIVSLTLSDLTREFQQGTQGEDRVQTATASASYRISPRTTGSSSLSFIRNSADAIEAGGTARDDDIWRLNFGLTHQFTEDFSGSLLLRHTRRDSNVADADFEENRLTATVNMTF